ncbi:MAG: hypothetical protein Fur0023_22330 [Bacteroidia bacterium]
MEDAFILMTVFCKKKNQNSNTSSNSPNSTTPSNPTIIYGLPGNLNQINGLFLIRKIHHLTYSYTSYSTNGSVSSVPKSIINFNPFLYIIVGYDYADTAKLNNITLKYDGGLKIYTDTTTTIYNNQNTITLKGNASFQGFSVSVRPFPDINNTGFIPVSISKSQGLNLNLGNGNITNTDSIAIMIVDNSTGQYVYKSFPGSSISCSFNSSELSFLTPGSMITQIHLYIKNYSYITIGGKVYVFCNYRNEIANVNVTS